MNVSVLCYVLTFVDDHEVWLPLLVELAHAAQQEAHASVLSK